MYEVKQSLQNAEAMLFWSCKPTCRRMVQWMCCNVQSSANSDIVETLENCISAAADFKWENEQTVRLMAFVVDILSACGFVNQAFTVCKRAVGVLQDLQESLRPGAVQAMEQLCSTIQCACSKDVGRLAHHHINRVYPH